MTSRLKHKLELENINLKSAYLNESFVQIGTPLPALAETRKDKLEYVPEWQQEVRDEQGRRRFHGAFTGGFSAGYYNSVGSKEGWAPSTFKSSRSQRANKVQRPEDFMDEEDLAQMNDDRRIESTEAFRKDAFAMTKEELANRSMPSALESLIAPARTSIGQTLLQKLGWRPGQGIGPRVTLRKLRIQEGKLGRIRLGLEEGDADAGAEDETMEGESGAGEAGKHKFAPRDTRLLVFQPKEEREGLGYEKGRGMGRLPKRGPAFGARPPDEEEDDVYNATGASSSSRAFAFDTAEPDEDFVVMGGPSRAEASRPDRAGRAGVGRTVPDDVERWHDGRPVLVGFMLDPKGVPPDKWFAMPEIPADWRPRPARVWGTTRKWDQQPGDKVEEKEVIRGAPGRPLTFEQRGDALGEEQRISKAKSVFEYISEKDHERLASLAAAAKSTPPPPLSLTEEPEVAAPPPRPTEVVIPPLSPHTAGAALRGYMPYGDDLVKQDRYRSYLSSQTYNTKTPYPQLRSGTVDEINKELDDFAGSARIFKPMSFAMSSRFTSGSASLAASDLKQAKPGLHIYDAEKAAKQQAEADAAKAKAEEVVPDENLGPREQAARNGMYGPLTREVKEWYPVKLLCRRFGVQDPHPEGPPKGLEDGGGASAGGNGFDNAALPKNDASWQDAFTHKQGSEVETASPSALTQQPGTSEQAESTDANQGRAPRNIAEVGMAEDANQGRDTLTYTKPSIDIFKAIFASDEDDEDEEEDEAGRKGGDGDKDKGTAGAGSTGGLGGKESGVVPTTAGPRERREDPFAPKPTPRVKVEDEGPVDLATFKPVFSRRRDEKNGDEERNGAGGEQVERAERKEKKRKKDKEKRKGVLSFHVDEGEDGEGEGGREDRKRKKSGGGGGERERQRGGDGREDRDSEKRAGDNGTRERERETTPDEDMGEWVEKPAINPRVASRKGAADFM